MIHDSPEKGFTLIELLVAMGLFLVVVILASGAFIEALRSQRAAVELIAINDNASLTLEQMAREIRVGENFSQPSVDSLKFTNSYGKPVAYRLNSAGVIERSDGGSFEALTATNVLVQRLAFITTGFGLGDGAQPRVTISISISGRGKNLQNTSVNLETTISPRVLEGL